MNVATAYGSDIDKALSDLNCRVYQALGAAGIEIPRSKHGVYIR